MHSGGLDQLERAIELLESETTEASSRGSALRRLHRLRSRLDAQVSRRVAAFDAETGAWSDPERYRLRRAR